MTEYLDPLDIDVLIGRLGLHYRDRNLMLSALARPMPVFGEEPYPTIHEKAATLLIGIVTSHPLLDGNKRTGLRVTAAFLYLNGYDLDTDGTDDFIVHVAESDPRDDMQDEVAAWINTHIHPLPEQDMT